MDARRPHTWRGRWGLVIAVALIVAGVPLVVQYRRAGKLERGIALMQGERWSEAIRVLAPLGSARGYTGAAARFNIALSLYHDGRHGAAAEAFLAGNWSDYPVLGVRAAFNAGNCACRVDDFAAARMAYRRAIDLADSGLDHMDLTAAAVLREVRSRAVYNLALVEGPASAVPGAAVPAVQDDAQKTETQAQGSATGNAEVREASGEPGSATEAGPDRPSDLTRLLEDAMGRDTGPVLKPPVGPAFGERPEGYKDW